MIVALSSVVAFVIELSESVVNVPPRFNVAPLLALRLPVLDQVPSRPTLVPLPIALRLPLFVKEATEVRSRWSPLLTAIDPWLVKLLA